MSATVRLPRISLLDRPARRPKHRASDEVERLRGFLQAAHHLIAGQQLQLDDKDRALADSAGKQAEAEMAVVKLQADVDDLTEERDQLAEQLLALRLRFGSELAAEANANAVSVPPMVRDTSDPADQATGPIDVRALWDARDAGLLGPLRPVLDPGHI